NTVFPAQNEYPQNKKINFVIFYNDLCIPLNSNESDLINKNSQRITLTTNTPIGIVLHIPP
ncbi:MAG: hypothetical protein E7B61_15050, partial [Clostridiales bacterium]|nr:hypothetical protein [Clostridiales bacterium]